MPDRTQFTRPDDGAQMAVSACALVFSHASDAMLLLRVQQPDHNGSLSFIIQAANPSAAERIRSFGHADNFIEKNIDDVFPSLVQKRARAEYIACVNTATIRRYKITPPGGAVTLESIAAPVLDATQKYVTHITDRHGRGG